MHSDLDIGDVVQVRAILSRLKPDAVINTAAFNRVDDCEDDLARGFSGKRLWRGILPEFAPIRIAR